jgi:hypothetical protein
MSDNGRPGPAGVSIGRAFPIRQGIVNDDLREAIQAIERTHGDGELPTVPIRSAAFGRDSRVRRRGRTVLDTRSGLPVVILIAPNVKRIAHSRHYMRSATFSISAVLPIRVGCLKRSERTGDVA